MEKLTRPKVIEKIVKYAIICWGVLLIPILIMIVLILIGHGNFLNHDGTSWIIMYYNLLFAPVIIILSSITSWTLLKKKRYASALVFVALPLVIIFIELVAVDIALWLV